MRNAFLNIVVAVVCTMLQTGGAKAETTVGRPHHCQLENLPLTAEGLARVAFTVKTDGTIENPVIIETSGDPRVDAASLRCVTRWLYKPATRDGVVYAAQWDAYIAWSPKTPPDITQLLRECAKSVATKYPTALDTEGTAIFSVRYENDKITGAAIKQSGGVKDVDDAEVSCLTSTEPARRERVIVNNRVDYSQANTYDVAITWRAPKGEAVH
jgi:TonB family protein